MAYSAGAKCVAIRTAKTRRGFRGNGVAKDVTGGKPATRPARIDSGFRGKRPVQLFRCIIVGELWILAGEAHSFGQCGDLVFEFGLGDARGDGRLGI